MMLERSMLKNNFTKTVEGHLLRVIQEKYRSCQNFETEHIRQFTGSF